MIWHCPDCGVELEPAEPFRGYACPWCDGRYPMVRAVPRFVSAESYAASFGFEWHRHPATQLDSATGREDSRRRLAQNLELETLAGKRVLDVGCGAGRFAEVALEQGATVVGVDLSSAVDVAQANLWIYPGFAVAQADLMALPLASESFDLVYCLGVLHHTPDPERALQSIARVVKPGGVLTVTVYSDENAWYVAQTDLWRRLTTRLPRRLLYALCHVAVPLGWLCRLHWTVRLAVLAVLPINLDPRWRWRVLDTFDCYSPRYQSHHNAAQVTRWFRRAGFVDIHEQGPVVSVTGRKPPT